MFSFKSNLLTKLLAAVALMSAFSAYAGTKDGGGGGAYVCRNADGTIRKSMLADLWEAQNTVYRWPHKTGKITISKNGQAPVDQLPRAFEKLEKADPALAADVRAEWKKIWADLDLVPAEISINVPDDLKNAYFPTGCPAEGMMYYDGESDRLNIRQDIFDALESETDKAAAYMHEALYKVMRDQGGHEDSRRSRRLVACLFSDEDCLHKGSEEVPADRIAMECAGKVYDFLLYPELAISNPDELRAKRPSWTIVARKLGNRGNRTAPRFRFVVASDGAFGFDLFSKSALSAYGVSTFVSFGMPRLSWNEALPTSMQVDRYATFSHAFSKVYSEAEVLSCRRIR